jgi:hypothetical protein
MAIDSKNIVATAFLALSVACGGSSVGTTTADAGGSGVGNAAGGLGQPQGGATGIGGESGSGVIEGGAAGSSSSGQGPTDTCSTYSQGQPQAIINVPVKLAQSLSTEPTQADSLIFNACRNQECYSGHLTGGGWMVQTTTSTLVLKFTGLAATPALTVSWTLLSPVDPEVNGDEYSLTYSADGGPVVSIFDVRATYTEQMPMTCVMAQIANITLTELVTLPTASRGEGGAGGAF